jgi:outer membrane protein assembly factor BamB
VPTRRLALLGGAAALLAGCGAADSLFGERRVPLPGERTAVLQTDPPLAADGGVDPRAITLPPPTEIAEWPMSGGPPSHAPGHASLPSDLRVAWRASAGSGSEYRARITSGPVVAGGVVYAVDAWGVVSAHALADGALRWRTDTTPETENAVPLGGGVAVVGDVAYVTNGLAEVLALSVGDGAVRWRVRLPQPSRGAPTVAGGRIFVSTIENQLVTLSAEDGRRLWLHRGATLATVPLGLPAPAVEGEAVVAGFGTGEVVALRVTDGRLLWSDSVGLSNPSLGDIFGVTGLPLIEGGRVIVTGLGNTTIAIDLRSGRRLWERAFGGGAGPSGAGDWIFSVTGTGQALALGREDGRIRWVTDLDPAPSEGTPPPAARFGRPMIAGGHVMVPSSRGQVLLLDPAGGAVTGRIGIGNGVTLPMAVAGGTLVALSDDGTLIALR